MTKESFLSEIKGKFGICLKSIFFLLLGVSSNFIGDTFGCQLQKTLSENLMSKQVLIFLTIYFGLDLSSATKLDPKNGVLLSAFIYIFYLVFTHMDHRVTIVSFCLLASIYFFDKYIDFYKKTLTEKKLKTIRYIKNQFIILLITTVVIGFLLQLNLRYKEFNQLNIKGGFFFWFFMNNTDCSKLIN